MGIKRLNRLKKEYREAVLSGIADVAGIENDLRLEAGNEFQSIVEAVMKEKSESVPPPAAESVAAAVPVSDSPAVVEAQESPKVDIPEDVQPQKAVEVEERVTIPEVMCRSHRNDVTSLPKSSEWEVCVDESYLGKDKPGVREGDFYGKDGNGLIAGVIFSPDNPLRPIGQIHCADDPAKGPKSPEELQCEDDALDAILNHPACGVFALPTKAQEMTLGYTDLLISWTCAVITMLPLPDGDGEVVVRCHVEPRAELTTASDFEAYRLSCVRQLRESFPALARRVRLECNSMPKLKGQDQKTLNSYADVAAHTCQHFGCVARKRFARTGWSGACFLEAEPQAVEKLLHLMFRGEPLDGQSWKALLKCENSGFARSMVVNVGERAKRNLHEWTCYLDQVSGHLRSGSIDMRLLKLQVGWLEKYYPEIELPRETELQWLTARLALANHEGHRLRGVDDSLRSRFDAACAALYEDNIGLVCRAVLHLAVAYTNAYEFDMALALVQQWLALDRGVVGLENYGQLLSSSGQHFAFIGETDRAIGRFSEALACFGRISDVEKRRKNICITSAYLATAVMDGRPEIAVPKLAYYLLGNENAPVEQLSCEAGRLAQVSSESFDDKFKHHILLRYIVAADRDDPMRRAYRACGRDGKWSSPGVGHPWELIEFYRALLSPEGTPARKRHFETAYRIAVDEGGDTVMVIASVIAGAALKEGKDIELWNERMKQSCQQVSHIQALWESGRFQALAEQTPEGLPALELAAKVLPFNFR